MLSPQAQAARAELQKEVLNPQVTLADERAEWEAYASALPLADGTKAQEELIGGIECCRILPMKSKASLRVLYAHGGGLVSGSPVTHRAFASHLAAALGVEVVLPRYRLLPENPIDAPRQDFVAAYCALMQDGLPVAFGGDSNGGALAVSAMAHLQAEGQALPMGCFIFSGAFDASLSGISHKEREGIDPMLSFEVLAHWRQQLARLGDLQHPDISPLYADLRGLPRMLLMVGTDEMWFSDSGRMADKLNAQSAPCELRVFVGMWHVWPMVPELPETRDAFEMVRSFLASVS